MFVSTSDLCCAMAMLLVVPLVLASRVGHQELPCDMCVSVGHQEIPCDMLGHQELVWLTKPLASVLVMQAGRLSLASSTTAYSAYPYSTTSLGYGTWVVAGLVLCVLGDVVMISKRREYYFTSGLGCFLLANLLFSWAFITRGVSGQGILLGMLVFSPAGFGGLVYVLPNVRDRSYVQPIITYAVVLAFAGIFAVATCAANEPTRVDLALGLGGRALSDLFVARDKFVSPSPLNPTLGLPLHYLSLIILGRALAYP
eukprot:g9638.t1